jgi:hypothetical protein
MATTVRLPLHRDETIYAGATWRRRYRWRSDGEPVDLSAWVGRMRITPHACVSSAVYLLLDQADGGVTLTANGDIQLYATDEQTAAIPRTGDYVVELVAPGNGDVVRFVMGRAQLMR